MHRVYSIRYAKVINTEVRPALGSIYSFVALPTKMLI